MGNPFESSPAHGWTAQLLANLRPGPTMIFRLWEESHRHLLYRWLLHLDTLLGMNLQFDLQYLRSFDPRFRLALHGRHHIIDLSVVNYLHSETRPERSLKSIGPVIRTHAYDNLPPDKRFKSRSDPAMWDYNGQDTHNTTLAVAELSRRIIEDFPTTDKLSPFCQEFYSDTIWSCIRMSENGIPMSLPLLLSLEERLGARMIRCLKAAEPHGLLLKGEGSQKSKDAFLAATIKEIDGPSPSPSVLDHPLLVYTDKTKKISWSEENRNLLTSLLPPRSPRRRLFSLATRYTHASKVVSSYTFPLLRHQSNKPDNQSSRLIPRNPLWIPPPPLLERLSQSPSTAPSETAPETPSEPSQMQLFGPPSPAAAPSPSASPSKSDTPPPLFPTKSERVWLAHPTWFPCPTFMKDTSGAEGGTQQGRIVCKGPAAQTFPPEVQECVQSRHPRGVLVGVDANQAELRTAALLSGDSTMVAEYQKAKPDLHSDRAVEIFGLPFLIAKYGPSFLRDKHFRNDTNGERQVSKHVNFADLFRSGPSAMQAVILEMTGILFPLAFFQRIVDQRPTARPGLWAWQESLIATARRQRFIVLPFTGQSRSFMGGTNFTLNEIVNFPVQTTSGNAVLRIAHYVHHHLPDLSYTHQRILPYLNVYDALKFDCVDQDAALECSALIDRACKWCSESDYWAMLQEHYGHSVPLVLETKLSPSPVG